MFTGFIYRHIEIGVMYVNKPLYELLSEKKFNHFSYFSKLLHYFIMCVVCALYALCAGAAAHRHYNCKMSKSRSGTVNDNKTVYISLEALALSAVSTSE